MSEALKILNNIRTLRAKSALLTLSVKKFLLIVAMPFLNSR